ncbi:MAG TPA: tRNA pseudouridine(38-40) synthase TruA, partial [Helicobacter sp.]|nr:tRNA pseudouridine(38-40) synthase TruA [Helicobacter sp.]
MCRFKAVIAYDGSAFSGFALQKHRRSVLGELIESFARVGIGGEILGASRTDKGVHATAQGISFQNKH